MVKSRSNPHLHHPASCQGRNRTYTFTFRAWRATTTPLGNMLVFRGPATSTQVHKQGRMDSNHHPRIPSPVRCRGIARGLVTTACGMRTGRLLQPFLWRYATALYFGLHRSCQGGSRTPNVTLTGCRDTISPPGSKERATMLDLWFNPSQ